MFKQKLEQYYELIVRRGINVQKDDVVFINADVCTYEFVQPLVEKIYQAGAADVEISYTDEVTSKYQGLHGKDDIFDVYPQWQKARLDNLLQKKAKRISIASPNPEGMTGVDSSRIMRLQKAAYEPMMEYRQALMGDHLNWTIAAVPNINWARKVFPQAETDVAAVELLWDAIFDCVHLNDGPNACENWDLHVAKLHQRVAILNELNLKTLHYTNTLGTDLFVGLPEGHRWEGGGSHNVDTKERFAPNIPTEEVFTAPDANRVDGIVYSALPLLFSGQLIENFSLEFKDGKVVKVQAEQNAALLEEMITADAGASRLGEVALVPYNSPISLSGNLFYMTLFDENASCHFALGKAYVNTLPACIGKSEEEQIKMGLNHSMIHVDFMVGTPDLQITGIDHDGKEIAIFKDGNFVI